MLGKFKVMDYLEDIVAHYRNSQEYLIDTCILIDFLKAETPKVKKAKVVNLLKQSFNISIITKTEFLSWVELDNNEKLRQAHLALIGMARVVNLSCSFGFEYSDNDIALTAAELRRVNKGLKTPDSLIAATALIGNYTLVTSNTKDFEKIAELDVIFV